MSWISDAWSSVFGSKCAKCKASVNFIVIVLGGLLGIVAAYSAGSAAPAYFVAIAAALSISVTTLYAILGAILAGTVTISGFAREVCRRRGKCN